MARSRRVAGSKGHTFIVYFLFSVLFFPAALLTAYLVKDRRASSSMAPSAS